MALRFDNRFIRDLPGEPQPAPGVRQVRAAWSPVAPTPVEAPRTLAVSRDLADRLGIDDAALASDAFARVFAGNALWPGMETYAANYGGHQFGHWAGQLGDGRAIGLGEAVATDGSRWELQLKGAGPTPYSRQADGRAVLRSSIREFLCSEAMHALGVPTTRALSLVGTGERVERDMFYDGRPRLEPGAVVCRAAPSFIRFGTFELPASRGDEGLLRALVDFCIDRDFPGLQGMGTGLHAAWFAEVCGRTAVVVAHWMRVGFVHGVLNTDNMSILGLTIDYGPFGWIEDYDPDWTPNTTDAHGRRYRFGWQPRVAGWNLARLAQALSPLFEDPAPLQAGLQRYVDVLDGETRRHAGDKLGLDPGDASLALMDRLLPLMQAAAVDMTLWFGALAQVDVERPTLAPVAHAFPDGVVQDAHAAAFDEWLRDWAREWGGGPDDRAARLARMARANPVYVPRNWLLQQAIDRAEAGDMEGILELQAVFARPYEPRPGLDAFARRRPDWARTRPGCAMLSCSS
ncbi:YdiU family protein [Luteimonas pelagia]